MKKVYLFIVATLMVGQLFAGGIVTNANQSAHYVRLLSRNASYGIDAVYYNPAGLVRMDDGFHLSFNNQTIFQEKTVTTNFPYLNSGTFIGDVSVPFFPSFFAVYKKDKLALSFGFGPNGGGGSAEYKTGLPSFEMPISMLPSMMTGSGIPTDKYSADVYFDGSSIYWGGQIGASYAVNEMFAFSAGVRIVSAKNVYQGHLKNIQINPNHPYNPNGAGNMVGAPLFFTTIATASYTAGGTADALGTAGFNNLEDAQTAGAITASEYAQLAGGLGANYVPGMPLTSVEAMYNGAGDMATANATATEDMIVDATQTGMGFTPYLGANININDKLNIGIKYEFNTKLELTNKADADKDANGMFKNDSTYRSDIPAILGIGVEYSLLDELRLSVSWNHYFDKNADWNGKEKFIDKNLYEIALGLEYDLSEKITLSCGYLHGQTGVGQGYQTDISYSNSSNTVGFGGRLNVSEQLSIDLGALFTMYTSANEEKTYMGAIPYKETYDKSLMDFAIGVNYRF